MTDTLRLKELIAEQGIKLSWVAEYLGLSRNGLFLKMTNESEFKASEIAKLKQLLRLTDVETGQIFFNRAWFIITCEEVRYVKEEKRFSPVESAGERISELERNVKRLYILHIVTVILFGGMILGLIGRVNILYRDVAGLHQLVNGIVDALEQANVLLQELVRKLGLL